MAPKISVIMPVYNGERFLRAAIESVLQQTFSDFEFLIIDDGSNDNTARIIGEYADKRIKYFRNEKNSGLPFTLNRGVELAKAKYIARMDADDISLPSRFGKQVDILDADNKIAFVDCIMQYVDENDKIIERTNAIQIHFEDIKKEMPRSNCLGHSSIMIRSSLLQHYRYENVGNEDYELWLRILADGNQMYKINEVLLLYRIHAGSYTLDAHKKGIQFFRQARSKWHFLKREWFRQKRLSWFSAKTFIFMLKDGILQNNENKKREIVFCSLKSIHFRLQFEGSSHILLKRKG
jgi:glycosyltransferase involved in cell wall biosynthesis